MCADLVDHHNADVKIGTVFPIILAVDHHVGADGVVLLQLADPRRELLGVHAIPTGTEDCHKTASFGQLLQSGLHVLKGRGRVRRHAGGRLRGEGRIHEDDRGRHTRQRGNILHVARVLPRHEIKAHVREHAPTPLIQLVDRYRRAPCLGIHGQTADPRRGLQNHVGGLDVRRPRRQIGNGGRRGELLELLLLGGTVGLGG